MKKLALIFREFAFWWATIRANAKSVAHARTHPTETLDGNSTSNKV